MRAELQAVESAYVFASYCDLIGTFYYTKQRLYIERDGYTGVPLVADAERLLPET